MLGGSRLRRYQKGKMTFTTRLDVSTRFVLTRPLAQYPFRETGLGGNTDPDFTAYQLLAGDSMTDLGSMTWMPLKTSTSCVTRRSAAKLHKV